MDSGIGSSSMNSLLRPRVFDGNHFDFWSARLKSCMECHEMGLWNYITDGYVFPVNPTTGERLHLSEYNEDQQRACKRENRAKFILMNAITCDDFMSLPKTETAKEIYDSLKLIYIDKRREQILESYENFVMMPNESIEHAHTRFQRLMCEMEEFDLEFNLEKHLRKFLTSLSFEWIPVINGFLSTVDLSLFTFEDMIPVLKCLEATFKKGKLAEDVYIETRCQRIRREATGEDQERFRGEVEWLEDLKKKVEEVTSYLSRCNLNAHVMPDSHTFFGHKEKLDEIRNVLDSFHFTTASVYKLPRGHETLKYQIKMIINDQIKLATYDCLSLTNESNKESISGLVTADTFRVRFNSEPDTDMPELIAQFAGLTLIDIKHDLHIVDEDIYDCNKEAFTDFVYKDKIKVSRGVMYVDVPMASDELRGCPDHEGTREEVLGVVTVLKQIPFSRGITDVEWRRVTQVEANCFPHLDIWKVVDKPEGDHVMGTSWIPKENTGDPEENNSICGKLLVQGYSSVEFIDPDFKFAFLNCLNHANHKTGKGKYVSSS